MEKNAKNVGHMRSTTIQSSGFVMCLREELIFKLIKRHDIKFDLPDWFRNKE